MAFRLARIRRRVLALCVLLLAGAVGVLVAVAHHEGRPESLRERKGRLREARLTPVAEDAASTLTEIGLVSSSGLEGRALLRAPRASTRPVPGAVVLGGIKRGRRIVTARGLDAIAARAALIGVDYPLPSRRGAWQGLEFLRTAARVRPAAFDTIALVSLALDYLQTRADVDPARLFVIGGSLGGAVATIAGAVDGRPAAVVVLYGGARIGALTAHTLQHASQHAPWPRWPAWFAGRGLAVLLTPLEPSRYVAAIAPRPLLMVNGAGDSLVPRERAEALYAAARDPKQLVWVAGEHVQPSETDRLERLSDIVTAWLSARGLLDARP